MKMRSLLLVLLPLICQLAFADKAKPRRKPTQASFECKERRWNGSRELTLQQWVAKLESMPRAEVREIAWGEVLAASSEKKPVFPVLLMYLAKTESVTLVAGYYEGILYLMNPNLPWRQIVEKWPQQKLETTKLNSTHWNLQRLCDEFKMAGGAK